MQQRRRNRTGRTADGERNKSFQRFSDSTKSYTGAAPSRRTSIMRAHAHAQVFRIGGDSILYGGRSSERGRLPLAPSLKTILRVDAGRSARRPDIPEELRATPLSHHPRGPSWPGIAGDHKGEGDAFGRAAHRRAPDRRDSARPRRDARNTLGRSRTP